MASPLLLMLLFLTPATVANLKTGAACPACWGATFDPESQRELLLDLAKKRILDKLHLHQRPTLSRPVSRAALKTALQRLRGPRREAGLEHDQTQEYEIISFADTGPSSVSQTRLDFHFSDRSAGSMEVRQAHLMLFVKLPPNATRTVNIRVLVLRPYDTNLTLTSHHLLQVDASGWHQLLLGPEAQAACTQGHLTLELVPESQVAHGSVILGGFSHRPFVAAQVRVEGKHRVRRQQGINCQGGSKMCCRQEFFVDFREIGWHDWVIQPEGYAMNLCTGQCPRHVAGMPGVSASFHTTVLNLLKANTATGNAGGGSCCVPTAQRPLSLLYYDRDSNIVKTDIPDMVVEACGCS
ncbi:inhibin beta C chain [Acomys russatus]|uniref:inhibin beta C chain n=1 Tax=Acomys russatus TaxID=60746 RepID=UPI0021E2CA6E|nr:inhibin beta C chain [Acomys russatus]